MMTSRNKNDWLPPRLRAFSFFPRHTHCWLPTYGWMAAWLVLVLPTMALDASRKADSYSVQSWSTQQGLPSSKIRDVTETRDGYLWIATAQGMARFDGSHFTVFTRATNPELGGGGFYSVVEAPDRTLWFGGDNGLFCRRNGHFEHFTTKDGLADDYVRMLFLSRNGTILVCTRNGFSVIRDGRITTPGGMWQRISRRARSYLERTDGSILVGNADEVRLVSGEHDEPFSGASGLPGDGFPSLAETPDGSVWIAHNRGLRRASRDGKIEDYGEAQGLLDPQVAALRADRDGNLWIGTTGGVLYRLANGRIEAANYSEQSDTTPIRQIYEDREGGLWVATATGLFRLKDNISSNIGLAQGLKRTAVTTVLETREGPWWIGLMSGGVYHYDGVRATQSLALATARISEVTSLAEDPGGPLWIGTLRGLYRYDGSMVTNLYHGKQEAEWLAQLKTRPDTVLPGLAHRRVSSIAADGSGRIWIATEGSLYHECEGGFRAYTKADGLPGDTLRSVICSRHGDIWVTAQDGVGCLHAGRWTNYLCGKDISGVFPHFVYEDTKGTIWVTTDGGGINRFKEGCWRIFTIHDGLDDNYISGVTEDQFDNLWIACPSGIMRIPLKQFDDLSAGRRTMLQPRLVNQSDGLPSAEVNQMGFPNVCRARDGRLLFATDRGVAIIQPGNLKTGGTLPPTYIERFIVNGADVGQSSPLVVPPGNNDVQVYYTAINLLAAEKTRFKIRLEPLDRDWVDTGARRDVRYAKLPPGHYDFRVIACNSDGIWNETAAATKAFIVQPFFYQTGWFTGLMIMIAGGVGFAFYRAYKLRLAKESAEAAVSAKNEFIVALKQAELERECLHKQLLETSHQAGMSEVASNVLHNVGNVLNSVNVSATLVADLARQSKVVQIGKAVALLDEHAEDLAGFITSDPRGVKLRDYLRQLGQHLEREQQISIGELDLLCRNIEHIKDIVAMQQSYAKVSGLTEVVNVVELVEDSVRMNDAALQQHRIQLVREYRDVPAITVQKHKVLQILVNLIRNAKHACDEGGRRGKQVTLRIANGDGHLKISVADNGVGIPPENLVRIFNHGFTTRKGGHGFGLHSGALAAKELGGVLTAHSDGPGHGAVFTLKLPFQPPATNQHVLPGQAHREDHES